MDAIERDDFVHALGQTLAFYGKELDQMQTSFWLTACRDKGSRRLKAALIEYTKIGKYAPRPADILAIVDNMSQQNKVKALPPPPTTNCPPDIAQAWMWFINRMTRGSSLEGLFDEAGAVDLETQEKYLHIVNHEAHKYGTPEAIPDEYKLREVWA